MEKVKNLEFFLPKNPPKNKNHKQEKKKSKQEGKQNKQLYINKSGDWATSLYTWMCDSKERGYFKPNLCLLIEYRQTDHLSK